MATTSHSNGPVVVSIVAKSNTGKTTIIEDLIPELQGKGLSVGVVKHHSHLSSFDVPGKDTYRLAQAGANVVLGISPIQVAVFYDANGYDDYEGAVSKHCADVDLVLTEGFKLGPYPKIEVHRTARSDQLLCEPEELVALVSDRSWDLPVPWFSLDDAPGLAEFLAEWTATAAR